jgi:hypothetical protein
MAPLIPVSRTSTGTKSAAPLVWFNPSQRRIDLLAQEPAQSESHVTENMRVDCRPRSGAACYLQVRGDPIGAFRHSRQSEASQSADRRNLRRDPYAIVVYKQQKIASILKLDL